MSDPTAGAPRVSRMTRSSRTNDTTEPHQPGCAPTELAPTPPDASTGSDSSAGPESSTPTADSADRARVAELEELPTQELHDRAVHRAERHLDVRFFWNLLSEIPAAQALSGDEGEAEYDVQHVKGLLSDALRSGHGELREALRPIYIDYLRRHPKA